MKQLPDDFRDLLSLLNEYKVEAPLSEGLYSPDLLLGRRGFMPRSGAGWVFKRFP